MTIDFTRRILVSGTAAALMALCLFQMPAQIARGITTVVGAQPAKQIEVLSCHLGIGLVRGQTLRITVSDPNQLRPTNERGEPVRARVRLLLADGSVIRESPEFAIPKGGFHFVDFGRADFPVPGESLTGRVQVLAEVILFVRDARASGLSPVSGDLIDEITGKTQIYVDLSDGVVAAGDNPT